MHGWIERRAPAAIYDANRGFRITARRYCPNNFFHVGWIDVLVNDDHEPAVIIARARAKCGDAGLLGVAMIALLQRNDDERRTSRCRGTANVTPYTLDVRDISLCSIVPNRRGADRHA